GPGSSPSPAAVISASKSTSPDAVDCFNGYFMPPAAGIELCVCRSWMYAACGCGDVPAPQARIASVNLPSLTSTTCCDEVTARTSTLMPNLVSDSARCCAAADQSA